MAKKGTPNLPIVLSIVAPEWIATTPIAANTLKTSTPV